jgi:hypothetical protein
MDVRIEVYDPEWDCSIVFFYLDGNFSDFVWIPCVFLPALRGPGSAGLAITGGKVNLLQTIQIVLYQDLFAPKSRSRVYCGLLLFAINGLCLVCTLVPSYEYT